MWRAWGIVRRDHGAAGIDRTTLAMVEQYGVTRLLDQLAVDLEDGSYRPLAARRLLIPKPGSSERRPLSIPTVRDRMCRRQPRSGRNCSPRSCPGCGHYPPARGNPAPVTTQHRKPPPERNPATRGPTIDLPPTSRSSRHSACKVPRQVANRVTKALVRHDPPAAPTGAVNPG